MLTIKNCYSVSARVENGEQGSEFVSISSGASASVVISNCYSLTDCGIVSSTLGATITATNNYYKGEGNISDGSGCTSKTFAELQNQSTYSGWTFGTAGVSASGCVFVNKSITIGGSTVTISLPRLAWECL